MGDLVALRWQELIRMHTEYLGQGYYAVSYGDWVCNLTEQKFNHELECGTLGFDRERQEFVPMFKDRLFGSIVADIARDMFFEHPVGRNRGGIPDRFIEKQIVASSEGNTVLQSIFP